MLGLREVVRLAYLLMAPAAITPNVNKKETQHFFESNYVTFRGYFLPSTF